MGSLERMMHCFDSSPEYTALQFLQTIEPMIA